MRERQNRNGFRPFAQSRRRRQVASTNHDVSRRHADEEARDEHVIFGIGLDVIERRVECTGEAKDEQRNDERNPYRFDFIRPPAEQRREDHLAEWIGC